MKKFLVLIAILVSTVSLGQITVDETLTTQQLVEDILINSPCADASNFIQSTGTNFGDDNGIAAFVGNGSSFPFTDAFAFILTNQLTEMVQNLAVLPGTVTPIEDYFLCDNDGDGLEISDLTTKEKEILNTLVDVTLAYHETQAEADASFPEISPVPAPSTGCFRVVELALFVSPTPAIPLVLESIIAGDSDMDGFEVFDLTEREADIMVVEVSIFFDPSLITTCDEEIADGIAEFDLNINNSTITGGDTGLIVSYYSSLADVEAPINTLPVLYTNTINLEDVWVCIEDNANGFGETDFNVGVVDYPDYFTPNNDWIHDEWKIIGIEDFDPTANIYIFDRYGKLLKQLSPLTTGWNGAYKDNPLPSSNYWFRVEYTEQEV